jgi:hydroxymethylpyrimidine pyrophosphatase-like HAD family hydrolase
MLPRYLIADVDDTFTVEGHIHPAVLAMMAQARAAGIDLILNTGRPAGYGAALLSYLPSISAVVVENGGGWVDHKSAAGEIEPGPDRGNLPVQFAAPRPPDLRQRLIALRERVAAELQLRLRPTADDDYRVTDHTVIRSLPAGPAGSAALAQLARAVDAATEGCGRILASSIHIHFMLDGDKPRSKASGVAALLHARGVTDAHAELAQWAVAVGDSANDASLFEPGRFALSVGVRNIERYLPELGPLRPHHITKAPEGLGLCELLEEILAGRFWFGEQGARPTAQSGAG